MSYSLQYNKAPVNQEISRKASESLQKYLRNRLTTATDNAIRSLALQGREEDEYPRR